MFMVLSSWPIATARVHPVHLDECKKFTVRMSYHNKTVTKLLCVYRELQPKLLGAYCYLLLYFVAYHNFLVNEYDGDVCCYGDRT